MKHEICFRINDIDLYEDIILLELDYPVLFVCKDNFGHHYLVLCTDYEEYEFYVMSITRRLLLSILKGEEEIKKAFLESDRFYKVYPGKTFADDYIIPVNPLELLPDELPDDDTFYNIETDELRKYIYDLEHYEMENNSIQIR